MPDHPTLQRFLRSAVFSERFKRQMRFIAGPRQCGKTTLALQQLKATKCPSLYFNWDRKEIRSRYRREGDFLAPEILKMPPRKMYWACFDEIHKRPGWKNILKDFFDTHQDKVRLIVTGSARLDLFRKSGDSLAGRYFLFRLNPLMLGEARNRASEEFSPEKNARQFLEKMIQGKQEAEEDFEHLIRFSGFPEPFLSGDGLFFKKWKEDYFERIVQEDLRDISHIRGLERIMDLIQLLPPRIGSPLSINALREELEVNFNTLKNYLRYLVLACVLFEVPPYHPKSYRFIKKEKKVYFYDWTQAETEASQFENYVAMEWKARVDFWNDTTEDEYGLFYVKTREGCETDFLITRNEAPWLLIETKLSETSIAAHHEMHARFLGSPPLVQIVKGPHCLKVKENRFYTVSAARLFA